MSNNIKHIAIIMDGNSRWAKKHGLPVALGHKKGAEAARKTLIACLKLKIPYLTLYTFSSENWQRNPKEVEDLMSLLKFYLANELHLLIEQQVRVKIIGDRSLLADDILELINRCEDKTKENSRLYLQIALSYGGRDEIIEAQKKLLSDFISAKITIDQLDEKLFENYLYTNGVPDPDLLIRTSGEYRISNFLLWQLAYTELYFTKILWPDFNVTHLNRAINNYYKRERRYGLSKQSI
jgi:undecaprenyl diphosphate synthase